MTNTSLLTAIITLGLWGASPSALAQAPNMPDKLERKCDGLTGALKEQCLGDPRRMPDNAAQGPSVRGSCDALIGPEKEACLKRGGTVETGAKSGAGGITEPPQNPRQPR